MNLKKSTIWLIDIDGTVCEDIPNEESHRFRTANVLPGAKEKVQEFYDRGDRVTFSLLEHLSMPKQQNSGSTITAFHTNLYAITNHESMTARCIIG